MREVHLCPILMQTVIWNAGKCTEQCAVDCPIMEGMRDKVAEQMHLSSTHTCPQRMPVEKRSFINGTDTSESADSNP